MSVVVVTAFPVPEHRAEVIAAFEAAIARVHGEPGVELYALHEGRGPRRPAIRLGGQVQQRSRAQVLVPHPAGNAQKGAL
jgi:hypothetical protein